MTRLFVARLGERATVRVQNPVRLSDLSEPEPDVALLANGRDLRFHPGPADVLLIVEVADTTIGFDRRVKLPLYAPSGIPEVWIAVVGSEALEVHRDPDPTGYRRASRPDIGDSIAPSAFPEVRFTVDEFFGS